MEEHNIKLGHKYEDTIHGVSGVCMAKITYLERTPQCLLEWVDKTGSVNERWFEASQLRFTDK